MEGNLRVFKLKKVRNPGHRCALVCSRETFTHISKVAGTKIFFLENKKNLQITNSLIVLQ